MGPALLDPQQLLAGADVVQLDRLEGVADVPTALRREDNVGACAERLLTIGNLLAGLRVPPVPFSSADGIRPSGASDRRHALGVPAKHHRRRPDGSWRRGTFSGVAFVISSAGQDFLVRLLRWVPAVALNDEHPATTSTEPPCLRARQRAAVSSVPAPRS